MCLVFPFLLLCLLLLLLQRRAHVWPACPQPTLRYRGPHFALLRPQLLRAQQLRLRLVSVSPIGIDAVRGR